MKTKCTSKDTKCTVRMKPDKDTAVAIVSGPGLDAQLDFFRYTIESYRAKEQAEQQTCCEDSFAGNKSNELTPTLKRSIDKAKRVEENNEASLMIEDGNAVTVRDLFVIQEENDYEEDLRRRRVVLAFKQSFYDLSGLSTIQAKGQISSGTDNSFMHMGGNVNVKEWQQHSNSSNSSFLKDHLRQHRSKKKWWLDRSMVCETEVTMDPVTEECKTMFILNSGKNEVYSSQQMSYEQANVRFTCSRQQFQKAIYKLKQDGIYFTLSEEQLRRKCPPETATSGEERIQSAVSKAPAKFKGIYVSLALPK